MLLYIGDEWLVPQSNLTQQKSSLAAKRMCFFYQRWMNCSCPLYQTHWEKRKLFKRSILYNKRETAYKWTSTTLFSRFSFFHSGTAFEFSRLTNLLSTQLHAAHYCISITSWNDIKTVGIFLWMRQNEWGHYGGKTAARSWRIISLHRTTCWIVSPFRRHSGENKTHISPALSLHKN